MAKRKGLSKKLRFEVFKRDSFTCQYCGGKAPDVLLQADHITPVAKGGKDTILNLVTACSSCNGGKSDRVLSENQSLSKSRAQAELLQTRREQIEMMAEWHKGLVDLDKSEVDALANHWNALTGWHLTNSGRGNVLKLKKKFGLSAVMEAMTISHASYLAGNKVTKELFEHAFLKIGGICHNSKADIENPNIADARRIRNYVNKGLEIPYYRWHGSIDYILSALEAGISEEWIKALAWRRNSYNSWESEMIDAINEARKS